MMRKNRGLRTIAVLLAVVNLALLTGLYVLLTCENADKPSQRDALMQLIGPEAEHMDEAALEERKLQLLSDALRMVNYNPEAQLVDGSINIYLSNDENNTCSFSAELTLIENGQVIASAGLIGPGYRLEDLQCETSLSAGEYACLMTLHVYARDGAYLGRAGRHLMLSVK